MLLHRRARSREKNNGGCIIWITTPGVGRAGATVLREVPRGRRATPLGFHADAGLGVDRLVGLDPEAAFKLKEVFRQMCAAGSAIFFSTHVLDVAEKLCNKIAIIKGGKLIASGNIEDVRGDESLESVFMEVLENDAR